MKKKIVMIMFLLSILLFCLNYIIKMNSIQSTIESVPKNINTNQNNELSEEKLNFEVASGFYPLGKSIIENFYIKEYLNEFKVVSTNEAYKDIINGNSDIILVTEPSSEQIEIINSSGVSLEFFNIGKEPLIFYVNKKNKINNLNLKDIYNIYDGTITNWKQLLGNNGIITTYQLEKNNGSQTCFEKIIKDNQIDYFHKEIKDMTQIIRKVIFNKNGIGYAFNMFYTKMYNSSELKLISIENIEPINENFNNEKYPLLNNIYIVYNKNNKNTYIKKLKEYLVSNDGQGLIKSNGIVPIYNTIN